jgi:hypothetical protein
VVYSDPASASAAWHAQQTNDDILRHTKRLATATVVLAFATVLLAVATLVLAIKTP